MASVAEGDDGLSSFTNKKDFVTYLGVEPFSQLKNKWISGLKPEAGIWFCNSDPKALSNACGQLRIQDLGNGGRQTLFLASGLGKGWATLTMPGLNWEVGPYTLRLAGGFQRYTNDGGATGKVEGNMFLIGHDLFLWSPKGFLTGSVNTTGSVLFGTHFERTDVLCETAARCSSLNGGQFHRNTILLREWDLYYFVAPRMSIGGSILWYNTANLQTGSNNACVNLGVCNNSSSGRPGTGGSWVDGNLNFRYQF